MEKISGRTDLEENQEFDFGHTKFERPVRHRRGNVKYVSVYTNPEFGKEARTEGINTRVIHIKMT